MNDIYSINYNKLMEFCDVNKINLLDDYTKSNMNSKTVIKGNCVYNDCKNIFEKQFKQLIETGAYCKLCIKVISSLKRKKRPL